MSWGIRKGFSIEGIFHLSSEDEWKLSRGKEAGQQPNRQEEPPQMQRP